MNSLNFTKNVQSGLTIIPNEFIDEYMLKADGEFVKIYLLMLRLTNQGLYKGPDQLADLLELTQKDVARALNYWEKQGLLSRETSDTKGGPVASSESSYDKIPEVSVTMRQTPPKKGYTPRELAKNIRGTELEHAIYMAESYIGRPLSEIELSSFYYLEHQLEFPPDLIEYLVDYCVSRGKKSIRYMESVAINWYKKNINTVKMAEEESLAYGQNTFPVMKAFGIKGRNTAPAEYEFIEKWNGMGFQTDVIVEACNRTMLATHQASFPYANKILEAWAQAGVHSMDDVRLQDEQHQTARSDTKTAEIPNQKPSSNAFHNFEQRIYDYDDLEDRLFDRK